jgi:GNAT superfamily N-acetyltransferase
MKLVTRPLTRARWSDYEAIFDARGCSVARSCGCMHYRRSGAVELPAGLSTAALNRQALWTLVAAGRFVGLIGYRDRDPVGWISFGPRSDFGKLARSPIMKPVDREPVWSIVCFVVPPAERGQGVAAALLGGAIAYARRRRVQTLEAYPVDRTGRSADETMWFGAKRMYDRAGFVEVARRRTHRPVVRLRLREARRA